MGTLKTPGSLIDQFKLLVRFIYIRRITKISEPLRDFLLTQKIFTIEQFLKTSIVKPDENDRQLFFQSEQRFIAITSSLAEEFKNLQHKILTNNYRRTKQHQVKKYMRNYKPSHETRIQFIALSYFGFLFSPLGIQKELHAIDSYHFPNPELTYKRPHSGKPAIKAWRRRKQHKQFWRHGKVQQMPQRIFLKKAS